MPELYFDFGNADVKWYASDNKRFQHFMHAIAPLTASQWQNAIGRAKQPPPGYIALDGQYFIVGKEARRYIIPERPKGATRYTPEYYGVGLAMAISQAFDEHTRIVNLYASHAPRDIQYAQDIVKAAQGKWQFVTATGNYLVNIKSVETFDEPLGGFNHAVLTTQGTPLKNNPYRDSTVLVLDIGGYTCDVVAIDPGGLIDDSSLHSTVTGIGDVMKAFEYELRNRYREAFRDAPILDTSKLERALMSGFYQAGNQALACADLAEQSITRLVNDIIDIIRTAGGIANYDVILMTGGGSALVLDTLQQALPTIDFIPVERQASLIRFANVFGGAKMFALLRRLGML